MVADYPRLVVTRSAEDGTVYLLRPPGQDPAAILRVARLVLPEEPYRQLARTARAARQLAHPPRRLRPARRDLQRPRRHRLRPAAPRPRPRHGPESRPARPARGTLRRTSRDARRARQLAPAAQQSRTPGISIPRDRGTSRGPGGVVFNDALRPGRKHARPGCRDRMRRISAAWQLMSRARGNWLVPGRFSTSRLWTPSRDSSSEKLRPTGPPPMIKTGAFRNLSSPTPTGRDRPPTNICRVSESM